MRGPHVVAFLVKLERDKRSGALTEEQHSELIKLAKSGDEDDFDEAVELRALFDSAGPSTTREEREETRAKKKAIKIKLMLQQRMKELMNVNPASYGTEQKRQLPLFFF